MPPVLICWLVKYLPFQLWYQLHERRDFVHCCISTIWNCAWHIADAQCVLVECMNERAW